MKKRFGLMLLMAAMALGAGLLGGKNSKAAMVTGLQQTNATTTTVNVSWAAVLDSLYKLQISEDPNNWAGTNVSTKTVSENAIQNYMITGLSAGKSYYVRVGTFAKANIPADEQEPDWQQYEWCAPVEVVTAPDTTNMNAKQLTANLDSFSISCEGVNYANYYEMYLFSTAGNQLIGSTDTISTSNTAEMTTTIKLDPATKYPILVFACRKAASTGYVAQGVYKQCYFTTAANKLATSQFGVSRVGYKENSFDFSIVNPGNIDGVKFEFQNMSGKKQKECEGQGVTVTVQDFIIGSFYKYRVCTYVQGGNGKIYSEWSPFRYVGAPKKVSAKRSGKTIKCSWSKVSGAKSYTVYVSAKNKNSFKKVATLSDKKTKYTIKKVAKKALNKKTKYYVRLVANGKAKGKSPSDVVWTTI